MDPKDMRGWFLRVLHSQGQWKRAWSGTKCGHEVKCQVTVDKNRQCMAEVRCGKAQRGACEVRRLKWSERQQLAASEAPGAPQEEGGAQVPPLGTHVPHKVLGKRTGSSQTPRRTNHTETLAESLDDRAEAANRLVAERESNLNGNGREDG